jgi:PleD family two-component response regulator
MSEAKPHILVADDDPRIRNLLKSILVQSGYRVSLTEDGEMALEFDAGDPPDLFLLDISMPGIDGLEVCRRLKSNPETSRIPVIFISAMDETDDILKGFETGAADYITKPITPQTTLARVRTHLKSHEMICELERLNRLALDANPLTGLPGNNSVQEAIARAAGASAPGCVIYCDLDNFKAFNDKYGFARGDQAILFTARVLDEAARTCCGENAFLGHIGGDDFTLLVPSDMAETVGEEVSRRFDGGVGRLYDEGDRLAGGIRSTSRSGEEVFFPVMTISMGAVDMSKRRWEHHLEVVEACTEVKKYAKTKTGSVLCFDRRGDPPGDREE